MAPSGAAPKAAGLVPPGGGAADVQAPCTVYVGRISAEVSDEFVKLILEKCGKIGKWNRAADPNTSKLTSFGFCDFEEAQGVWRALEYLHERQLCDKRLLVKCEEKAKLNIVAWKESRRAELGKKRAEAEAKGKDKDGEKKEEKKEGEEAKEGADAKPVEVVPLTDEQLEEELKKESKAVFDELDRVLGDKNKGYPEVKLEDPNEPKAPPNGGGKDEKKGDHKGDDKENKENKDDPPPPPKDRPRSRSRGRGARVTRSEERRKQRAEEDKKPQVLSRHYRVSRRERDREQRVKDRERDIDKEYHNRMRELERGEDKRITNLKRDLRELELPPEPTDRDMRKFAERDLDFGKSESSERDWKRYREDRIDMRARENEKDAADRASEEKEADETKNMKEAEELRKRKEEEEAKKKAREEAEAERRRQREEEKAKQEDEQRKEQEELERKKEEERQKKEAEQKKSQEDAAAKLLASISMSVQAEMRDSIADSAIKTAAGGGGADMNPNAQAMQSLFRAGEDPLDANGQPRKHKPLQRLGGPEPGAPPQPEAKLRDDEMRRLIQQVPTDKAKAFAFQIDWQTVEDHNIVEKKLRPWVKKKVTEYLGEEEKGMIEFIMRKIQARTDPESILAELDGFLDEEAENFTLKMWRMLIFEVLRVKAR